MKSNKNAFIIVKTIAFNGFAIYKTKRFLNIKYDGYIKRNQELIDRFKEQEHKYIPLDFDYQSIQSLSSEAREKLTKIRPESFGQASRISGVSPADLSVLLIYLERAKYHDNVSRETSYNT